MQRKYKKVLNCYADISAKLTWLRNRMQIFEFHKNLVLQHTEITIRVTHFPEETRGEEKASGHHKRGREAFRGFEDGAGDGRPNDGRRASKHGDQAERGRQLIDPDEVDEDDGGCRDVGRDKEAEEGGHGHEEGEGVEEGEGEHAS